jgi:glycosyltransferase involved in cell wall biosynthesis
MSHVLIISPDVIGEQMAGVGIRYWNLAVALARHGQRVTLATLGEDLPGGQGFQVVGYDESQYESLVPHLVGVDVLLISGHVLFNLPRLKELGIPTIVDLWAPFILENLEVFSGGSLESQMAMHRRSVAVANEQLRVGDFFVCASEKQRDFWLGMLAANARLNPYIYAQDPTFHRLLAVVPFGLPAEPPQHVCPVLKGVHPRVGADDKVILWSGGIWQWYDPLTLIRAMQRVLAVRQDVRLVFLGLHHPNPVVSASQRLAAAVNLCQELGLYEQYALFIDWVPYGEMQSYLLEADIGTVLHYNHIETRFSFRARVLGYFWAQLPILITEGSPSSDIVRDEHLGRVVAYEDVEGTAQAILDMLALPDLRSHHRPHFERVSRRFTWDAVAQPIVDYCRAPYLAADRGRLAEPPPTPRWRLPLRAGRILMERGISGLAQETRSYVSWLRGRRRGSG